jgi:uncharacterized protein
MRRSVIALALLGVLGLFALLGSSRAFAAEKPIPATPARWVTDEPGFLAPATRAALDARLERYQQATGHHVIVFIGGSLGDSPLEDWTVKAATAWKVGQKGKDDGVVIFVFPAERKLRIEVGYGVEDLLPDAYASRIVHEVMEPALAAGHQDEAVTHGVDQVISRLGGEPGGVAVAPLPPARPVHASSSGGLPWWLWLIILVGGLGFAVTHPRAAWLFLNVIASSGGGGWGGGGGRDSDGGGGGYSGGGGRFGGGGASGGW